MVKLSLRINFPEKHVTKTLQFEPSLIVCSAFRLIKEKNSELNLENDEDFGLYLKDDDPKRGVWLDPLQSLEYYLLRDGDTLEYKRKIRTLRVKKLDGSVKTVLVDESQIVSKLIEDICQKIGITDSDEYSLVRESTEQIQNLPPPSPKSPTLIRKDEQKGKVSKMNQLKKKLKTDDQFDWIDHNKTLHEQGIDENQTLLFRKKFFFSDQNIDARDPIQLNLVYVQTRDAIIDGTLPVTLDMSCRLAGIQCQIELGDHIESKVRRQLSNLKQFLPKDFLKSKGVIPKILIEHKRHSGDNEISAKVKYVSLARSLDTYGVTFFLVEEKMKAKKKLVPRLLGVSKDGILRLDAKTKEIIKRWPITSLKRWAALPNSLTLDFGDYSDSYYSIRTNESERISQIISGYIDIILKRKKPKDYLGVEEDKCLQVVEHCIYPQRATFNVVEYVVQKAIKVLEATNQYEWPQNENQTASKQNQFYVKVTTVSKLIEDLMANTERVIKITSASNEEFDYAALKSTIDIITTSITTISQEIRVIVDLMEDFEKRETVIHLAKNLFVTLSQLFIAAETGSKTSPKNLLNVYDQTSKISNTLLRNIIEVNQIENEDSQNLLKLSKSVENASHKLVSKAEHLDSTYDGNSKTSQVVCRANERKTSISQLVSSVETFAHNVLDNKNQQTTNQCVQDFMISAQNIEKINQCFNEYEDSITDFKTETTDLPQALDNVDQLKTAFNSDGSLPKVTKTSDNNDHDLERSNEIEQILDIQVKQLIRDTKTSIETDSRLAKPTNSVTAAVKELVKALSELVAFVESSKYDNRKVSKPLIPLNRIGQDSRGQTDITTNVLIEKAIVCRLNNNIRHLLLMAKETVASANGYDLNNDLNNNSNQKEIGEELMKLCATISQIELLIEETQTGSSCQKSRLINACQSLLSQTFSLDRVSQYMVQELIDKSSNNQMSESVKILSEFVIDLETNITHVQQAFSSLVHFDKTIDLIRHSLKELEECQKTVNGYSFKEIYLENLQYCDSRLSYTCNSVGSAMFQLLTASTLNNYDFTVHSLRDICNSTTSFIKSVINYTSIQDKRDEKTRVIENATNVLENIVLLIEETKWTLCDAYDEQRERKFTQIVENIIKSLNVCANSPSRELNLNKSSRIITYKSQLFIEFLKKSNLSFNKLTLELSSNVIELDETTSELIKSTEDQNLCSDQIQDSSGAARPLTQSFINVQRINGTIKDLEKAATSVDLDDSDVNSELATVETDDILKIGRKLVEDTKSLVKGLMSNEKELVISTRNCMTSITQLTASVKLRACSLGFTDSEAQTLLLDAAKDVTIALEELIRATNSAFGKSSNDPAMKCVKEKIRFVFSKVASLLETDKIISDKQEMGEKALKTAIEAIDQQLMSFNSDQKTSIYSVEEIKDFFQVTVPVTLATDRALDACSTGKQFDVIVTANMGRKAISDLLNTIKAYKYESQHIKNSLFETAKSCANHYKHILQLLLQTIEQSSERIDIKHQLLVRSRIIYACVAEIVSSVKLIDYSDNDHFIEQNVTDANQTLDKDSCIKNKKSVCSQGPDLRIKLEYEEISFDRMILEAAKAITASSLALVKFISVAQHESAIGHNIDKKQSVTGQCFGELVTSARHLATVTHSLVETVIGLVRSNSFEKQNSGCFNQTKADLNSKAIRELKVVGDAVKNAKDDLVRCALRAFERN